MPNHYPVIIEVRGKHDNDLYLAMNEEDEARTYYAILSTNHRNGFYPTVAELEAEIERGLAKAKEKLDEAARLYLDNPEGLEELPGPVRDMVKEKLAAYKVACDRVRRQYVQEMAFAKNAEKVIALPVDDAIKLTVTNGRGMVSSLVRSLVMMRADYEYEEVEVRTPRALPR